MPIVFSIVALITLFTHTPHVVAQTVSTGLSTAAVRFRSFKSVGSDKDPEVYLGVPNLDDTARRVSQNVE